MTTIKVAFYKYPKTKPWYATFFNRLTCWWTRGQYSHVEVILSEKNGVYECGSSSARDRGSTSKWFCSEAVADCLGYRDAWRFDPNTLFVVLKKGK